MGALLSTIILDVYLILLSLQLNGLSASNDKLRLIILIFLITESILILVYQEGANILKLKFKVKTLVGCSVIYMIYIFIYTRVIIFNNSYLLQIVFFPLTILLTCANYRKVKTVKIYDYIIDLQFYILLVLALIYFIAQIKKSGDYVKNINTVYYLVFTLPFIMGNKNKLKRIAGLLIIVLCVFWSAKRTPLIAIGAVLLFVGKTNKVSRTLKILLRLGILLVIAIVLNNYFNEAFDIDILGRLLSMGEDGGSGRVDLAKEAISIIKDSSFFEILCGHSLLSTSLVIDKGVHNDFLEVLYRTGIVGFIIYLSFYKNIYNHAKACTKKGNWDDANLLYTALILFGIISFSSQLFFLPSYIAFIAMACNVAICRNEAKG